MLGLDERELAKVFDRIFDGSYDEAEATLKAVVARLPPEVQEQLADPDAFAVGTTDLRFNASAVPCENGGWAVIIDRRLMTFYFVVALILVHRIPEPESGSEPPLTLEEASGIAAELATNVRASGVPLVGEFPTDPARTHLASDLAVEAHRFVLSHELAHIALGHGRASNHVSMLRDLKVPIAEWSWEQELDADSLAMSLTLGPPPGPPQWEELAMRYAGCQLALDAVAFLDDYATEILGRGQIATHPPAAGRLARLRARADEACADDGAREAMFRFADELAQTLDSIRVWLGMLPTVPKA